ncbi:MAG: ThiF family adenylyltransferase [Bacilli bacterium]
MNNDIFSRYISLIGEEDFLKLQNKKVLVFGLGGVGGYCVEALLRSGISHFTLVDNDTFSFSNLNRQLLSDLTNIDKYKVDVFKQHILLINKSAEVHTLKLFYLPDNNQIDFSQYDYVIDAIDTLTSKVDIITKCIKNNVKVISALGCGNRIDPSAVEVCDIYKTKNDPLAKKLRQQLRKNDIKKHKVVYSKELPKNVVVETKNNRHSPASSVFVPSVCGIFLASEVIKDFLSNK